MLWYKGYVKILTILIVSVYNLHEASVSSCVNAPCVKGHLTQTIKGHHTHNIFNL